MQLVIPAYAGTIVDHLGNNMTLNVPEHMANFATTTVVKAIDGGAGGTGGDGGKVLNVP
jgi:hypothetical protein